MVGYYPFIEYNCEAYVQLAYAQRVAVIALLLLILVHIFLFWLWLLKKK